jgi:hypothetical protein
VLNISGLSAALTTRVARGRAYCNQNTTPTPVLLRANSGLPCQTTHCPIDDISWHGHLTDHRSVARASLYSATNRRTRPMWSRQCQLSDAVFRTEPANSSPRR